MGNSTTLGPGRRSTRKTQGFEHENGKRRKTAVLAATNRPTMDDRRTTIPDIWFAWFDVDMRPGCRPSQPISPRPNSTGWTRASKEKLRSQRVSFLFLTAYPSASCCAARCLDHMLISYTAEDAHWETEQTFMGRSCLVEPSWTAYR
jgi:hypothetical protein